MTEFSLNTSNKIKIHVVENCLRARAEIATSVHEVGHHCELYSDLTEIVSHPPQSGIVLVRDSAFEGGVSKFASDLVEIGIWLPVIGMDFQPRTEQVVEAIKAGALDFLTLPLDRSSLVRTLSRVKEIADVATQNRRRILNARTLVKSLSIREREVLELLSEGRSNKVIAVQLCISPRTVEIHRANMMAKLSARHPAEAVRVKLAADAPLAA